MSKPVSYLLLLTLFLSMNKTIKLSQFYGQKLALDFALEKSDSSKTDKDAEFKLNCYYMKSIHDSLDVYLKNTRDDEKNFLNFNSFQRMIYKFIFAPSNRK